MYYFNLKLNSNVNIKTQENYSLLISSRFLISLILSFSYLIFSISSLIFKNENKVLDITILREMRVNVEIERYFLME